MARIHQTFFRFEKQWALDNFRRSQTSRALGLKKLSARKVFAKQTVKTPCQSELVKKVQEDHSEDQTKAVVTCVVFVALLFGLQGVLEACFVTNFVLRSLFEFQNT